MSAQGMFDLHFIDQKQTIKKILEEKCQMEDDLDEDKYMIEKTDEQLLLMLNNKSDVGFIIKKQNLKLLRKSGKNKQMCDIAEENIEITLQINERKIMNS